VLIHGDAGGRLLASTKVTEQVPATLEPIAHADRRIEAEGETCVE
jgi:hypothetical protein